MKASSRARVASTDGIHARPCAAIAARVRASKSKVTLRCGANEADGGSVLALMGLEAERGAEVDVEAEGPDAEKVVADVVRILEDPRTQ